MESVENTILFGKYQLCRILGRGRSGTVYLAKHRDLEEYRAIKQVAKACVDYDQFRREALILKDIRHPGIPVVYDLEEDENFCYLIEEFLEGDSLYALISEMGHFSKAMTIRYGIQICYLVNILHLSKITPILYLDLQPENLLICDDTVKLVDFGHAIYLDEAKNLKKRYGTIGFAAPEQYTGAELNERTDIYAIGAVLYYMLTGKFPGKEPVYRREQMDRHLAKVIQTCLREKSNERYESTQQLCGELEKIQKSYEKEKKGVFRQNPESSLTIAVAGAFEGAGTTHIAIGFAVYLQRQGLSVLYEERNESGAAAQMAEYTGRNMDRYGIYRIYGLPVFPLYGIAVKLEAHPYRIIVRDYGVLQDKFFQEPADGYLLVCGSKPWQWKLTRDIIRFPGNPPGIIIIYNQFCRRLATKLPGPARETDCFLMPDYPNPFVLSGKAKKVYEELYQTLFRKKAGGILRILPNKIRRDFMKKDV
ncbi:MAG: serine/threonine protein kinase [Lachnospiraceae bacterium]|nr:serine/threonine protein kinase [Lachnospiraceae bacterium]MCI9282690.1 serine/threonine protein kinase [Lachnospiraceae bacterium]